MIDFYLEVINTVGLSTSNLNTVDLSTANCDTGDLIEQFNQLIDGIQQLIILPKCFIYKILPDCDSRLQIKHLAEQSPEEVKQLNLLIQEAVCINKLLTIKDSNGIDERNEVIQSIFLNKLILVTVFNVY